VLFGAGWEEAIALSAPLSVIAGVQIVSTVLASAVEALGRFRWIWATQGILFIVYCLAAIGVLMTHEWFPVLAGILAAQLIQHAIHIFLCGREGYLNVRVLMKSYSRICLAALALAGLSWLFLAAINSASSIWITITLASLVTLIIVSWKNRSFFEAFQIARKYRDR